MADGSVAISVDMDTSKADKDLAKLKKQIADTEAKISEGESAKSPLTEKAEALKAAIKDATAEVEKYKLAWMAGEAGADGKEAAAREQVTALRAAYDGVVASIDKIDTKLTPLYTKQEKLKNDAGELVQQIEAANRAASPFGESMKAAGEKASKAMDKLINRIKRLAARALVFSLITRALRQLVTWFNKALKTNDEARASIAQLKGALLTLVQPLVGVIIPALSKFIALLARIVTTAAALVSKLFGTTAEKSAQAAESLYDEQKALDGVGSAAKKAGKSLAGFDEINQLSNDSGGAGSGTGATIEPDFSGVVSGGLSAVEGLLVGSALMAIGAILTFSGISIPIGIGLMAAGALTLVSTAIENWGAISAALEGPIGVVTALVGGALLALGAILAFSGVNIPLGIALMAGGAAALATAIAPNWDAIVDFVKDNIDAIAGAVGVASLVLGALLTFSGVALPLGIALLAVGAAGLVTAAALNWDTIKAALQGPIGVVTGMVGAALLAIGAVLTFSGAALPLGIGMMVVGAAALAAAIVPNWDTIVTALQGPLGGAMAAIGAAMLVLGVILLFTGAGIPLGLGLILAGGASLAAAIAPNWDFLLNKIKEIWGAIKAFWREKIAPIFTAEWWGNLAKKCADGLISVVESALNKLMDGVRWLVNGAIKLLNLIPGVDIELKGSDWGAIKLPRLATGAVIPPNREFLAVLGDQKAGTNIEAPLDTIVQAFRQVMSEGGGGSSNRPIYLMLDRRELGRAVLEVGDQERVRVGVSLT